MMLIMFARHLTDDVTALGGGGGGGCLYSSLYQISMRASGVLSFRAI